MMPILKPVETLFRDIFCDFKQLSFGSDRSVLSVKTILSCLIALLIAWELNITDPTWAAWTAFIVMQSSRGATLVQTVERIGSTIACLFIGVLLLNLFGDNVLLLVLFSILLLTLAFYFLAKSAAPFVWMYGPLTFLLVLFQTVGFSPSQIMNVVYDRGLEVIIGTLCGLLVTLLFKTQKTESILESNNIQLLKQLNQLQRDCLRLYRDNTPTPDFLVKLTAIQNLGEAQVQQRRFVKQENIFNTRSKINTQLLEQVLFLSQEILADLYWRHTSEGFVIFQHLKQPLQQLESCIDQALQLMINFIADPASHKDQFHQAVQAWQNALTALITQSSQFRDTHPPFSIPLVDEWSYFLMRQEAFLQLIQNFRNEAQTMEAKIPQQESLRQRFRFDRYYWEYGLKTSLMAVLFPLLGLYFNLPGVVNLSVVVVVTLQFDLSVTRHKIFLLLAGACFGVGFGLGLIALNLTSMWTELLGIALIGYLLAYAKHGPDSYNFAGWLAAYLFFSTVTGSLSPILDWRNSIIGLGEIIAAAFFMLAILIWIWPFADKQVLAHFRAQLNWYQRLIQTVSDTPLFYREIYLFRQQIKSLDAFNWANPQFKDQLKPEIASWFRIYHSLSALRLSIQNLDLSHYEPELREFIGQILKLEPSSQQELAQLHQAIEAYRYHLRQRYLAGEIFPFYEGIKTVYLLSIASHLAEDRSQLLL